jgi:hypothetical protein
MTQHALVPTRDVEDPCEELVAGIVDQIRARGYFSARLPALTPQDRVHVRWVGQLAGRALGRPVGTSIGPSPDPGDTTLTVVVAPLHRSSTRSGPAPSRGRARWPASALALVAAPGSSGGSCLPGARRERSQGGRVARAPGQGA